MREIRKMKRQLEFSDNEQSKPKQPKKLSIRKPISGAILMFLTNEELCVFAPTMAAPDQAQSSELSMREPSVMAPSSSVPGREPNLREPTMAEQSEAMPPSPP